jgi:hypothetical protein
MRYHIYKATRCYEGRPYCGPASQGQPAQANTLSEAVELQAQMLEHNPVGWNIRDTETKKDVE